MTRSTVVVIAKIPEGMPKESDFEIKNIELPPLNEGEVLFQSLFISPDPYQRSALGRRLKIGEIMIGSSVAKVIETKNPKLKKGEIIVPQKGWVSHGILNEKEADEVLRHDPALGPESTAVGVLGMPGMTAYFGVLKILHPKAGDSFVVSGAAGAVGSLVGQIAKIQGCTVLGTAGSDEKCKYLKSLGFDYAINYKKHSGKLKEEIDKIFPDGVDCFFDNTGGEIFDAVMMSLKDNARICICGQISEYNNDQPSFGPRLLFNLVYKNATIKGFLVFKWRSEWPSGIKQMANWIKEGKIKYQETVIEGNMNAVPKAFINLLSGGNIGKQLVKLTL